MALTKITGEGISGISNSADATFLTATSSEGVTLAGTLAVTGVHTIGTNAVATSDGGAATTSIVQGLAKMWINFAGSGGQTVGDSFNISTSTDIVDDAVGRYTVNFANNMGNTGYSGSYDATAVNNNSGEATYIQTYATSSISVKHYENGTNYDSGNNAITVHGDLA
jgi:hypothetical protein